MTLKTLRRSKSSSGVSFIKCGSGPAIVLIHGVGLRAEAWLHQLDVLSQTNTVYAIDMPGHGESDLLVKTQNTDLSNYVDSIAPFIEQEVKQPVIMMGHSMGAMITLQFASRYPKLCRGAVALNAVYRRTEQARNAVQERAQNMLNNPKSVAVKTPILRWFGENPQGVQREMAKLCASWLENASTVGYAIAYDVFSRNDGPLDDDLAKLHVPVAFVTGDLDSNSSAEMSRKMAALTPQGNAHVIEDAHHMAQLTHVNEVNKILTDFVNQIETKTHRN